MLRPATRAVSAVFALAMAVCLVASTASAALIDLTPVGNAVNSVGSISMADLQSDPTAGIIVGDPIAASGRNDLGHRVAGIGRVIFADRWQCHRTTVVEHRCIVDTGHRHCRGIVDAGSTIAVG